MFFLWKKLSVWFIINYKYIKNEDKPKTCPRFCKVGVESLHNGHFFNQMMGTRKLVDDEEHIADVDGNVTADGRVV